MVFVAVHFRSIFWVVFSEGVSVVKDRENNRATQLKMVFLENVRASIDWENLIQWPQLGHILICNE